MDYQATKENSMHQKEIRFTISHNRFYSIISECYKQKIAWHANSKILVNQKICFTNRTKEKTRQEYDSVIAANSIECLCPEQTT